MFSALAEEVVTTTTTTTSSWSFSFKFDILALVFVLLALYDIVIGIMTIATKKMYGKDKSFNKYTDESIREQTPKFGLFYLLTGLGFGYYGVMSSLQKKGAVALVPAAVLMVLGVAIYIIAARKLVQKDAA